MTLLASERSILIRNKFRSVLQLRMQHRRQQNEASSDTALSNGSLGVRGERERGKAPDDFLKHKTPQRLPGPDPDSRVCLHLPQSSSDSFDDDISSSSASTSPDQSQGLSVSPGRPADHPRSSSCPGPAPCPSAPNHSSASSLSATESSAQPITASLSESDSMATAGRANGMFLSVPPTPLLPKAPSPPSSLLRPPRSKKSKDSKPKLRKLKYHQYIPPDQKGGAGGGAMGGTQGHAPSAMDSAYSRLLQQQQVFLQLQILSQQTLDQDQSQSQGAGSASTEQGISSSEQILNITGATPTVCPRPLPLAPGHAPSASGSASKPEPLPSNLDDLTVSELRQQLRQCGLPVSGTKPALLERLKPLQRSCPPPTPPPLTHSPFLTPPTAFVIQYQDVSVKRDMQERQRNRPRERGGARGGATLLSPTLSAHALTPPSMQGALQRFGVKESEQRGEERQQQGLSSDTDTQADSFTTQVFCSQPSCDVIGQDFELPMEITASPAQAPPTGRSLEEELQEAIQRVQMAPSQSIDDILDVPISSSDSSLTEPLPCPLLLDQSQSSQQSPPPRSDDSFLSEPLCPSLSLELPPSPLPPPTQPPPPPSPPPLLRASFDPADWLRPPVPPFTGADFGLDCDAASTAWLGSHW
ncbi:myocardin isoform X2 [Acipenser ruthenus]|uniref:myocardin isoform X2 n=1 Tax=Acipenser ruthenus TaxID=7906 RepID=UPI0027426C31|nr:myocardin isoform X2 [Acipenser ruthenus]